MAASIMLPLMCVAIEIGSSIFSFGKELQKRRPITHAIDRAHAAVGIRIEMAKNERGLIDSRVELLSEPIQLFVPWTPFLPESIRRGWREEFNHSRLNAHVLLL